MKEREHSTLKLYKYLGLSECTSHLDTSEADI
jgi:hypothetical protein